MTELWLARHTRPAVDPAVCYGRLDVPLAPTWQVDVERSLSRIPQVAVVISSPLKRCRILADAVARRDGVAVYDDPRLLEIDLGAWEGRRWDAISRAEVDRWAAEPLDYAPGGGESLRQLWNRVIAVLERHDVARTERTLLVSHLGPLRALIAHLGGLGPNAVLNAQMAWGEALRISLTTPKREGRDGSKMETPIACGVAISLQIQRYKPHRGSPDALEELGRPIDRKRRRCGHER